MNKRSQMERLKNDLITVIAHRVRTPLSIVKETNSLLLDEIVGKLNSKQKKLLANSKKNIDRLVNSLEDMLKNPWDKI